MKDTFKIYNNEAFVCCVIQGILSEVYSMDIGRLFLITTLALQDKITMDKNIVDNSTLIHYVNNNARKLTALPNMFEELLPIILNSLTLLCECSNVEIEEQNIVLLKNDFQHIRTQRFDKISKAIPSIISLSKNLSSKQLYDILKIKL